MADDPQADPELAAILASFAEEVQGWLEQLGAARSALVGATTDEAVRDAMQEISLLAHKLSGSAGTFGFVAINAAATPLEVRCAGLLGSDDNVTDSEREEIDALIHAVQQLADETPVAIF